MKLQLEESMVKILLYQNSRGGLQLLCKMQYGQSFCSMYAKNNLIATQFHPEKSGPSGLKLYRNFLNIAAHNTDDQEKTINQEI